MNKCCHRFIDFSACEVYSKFGHSRPRCRFDWTIHNAVDLIGQYTVLSIWLDNTLYCRSDWTINCTVDLIGQKTVLSIWLDNSLYCRADWTENCTVDRIGQFTVLSIWLDNELHCQVGWSWWLTHWGKTVDVIWMQSHIARRSSTGSRVNGGAPHKETSEKNQHPPARQAGQPVHSPWRGITADTNQRLISVKFVHHVIRLIASRDRTNAQICYLQHNIHRLIVHRHILSRENFSFIVGTILSRINSNWRLLAHNTLLEPSVGSRDFTTWTSCPCYFPPVGWWRLSARTGRSRRSWTEG